MELVGWAVLVLLVSTVGVAVSVRRGRAPGERRTYAFETETGDRDRAFSALSEEVDDSLPSCRLCGSGLHSRSYHYCSACALAD